MSNWLGDNGMCGGMAGRRSAGLGSDGVARQVSHAVGVRAVIRRLFGKGVRGGDSERQPGPARG
jgi:hypothetical protein